MIGIDLGAARMGTVRRAKRGISALAAFGRDDGVGKLELAQLGNREADARDRHEPDHIEKPRAARSGTASSSARNIRFSIVIAGGVPATN
jgi:hypothetical protein